MGVINPFSITYGERTVGGATAYQLDGPYVIEKSYESLRLVFNVIVTATSHASLQSRSETLESDFRKRLTHGDRLLIDLDGSTWTYVVGESLLKVTASITKSGDPDTDKAYSRAYTVAIVGELPADNDADAGLRNVEVLVDYAPSRQRTVSMRGTYTATTAGDAKARYQDAFDDEALAYLNAIGSGATWELATEEYSMDRERNSTVPAPHLCNFSRQYVELLADQAQGSRDDEQIKDHRVVFTDLSQHPGDSARNVKRLRRVIGSYDCAVDIEKTTDLQAVIDSKIRPHIRELFRTNFDPMVFAVEEQRIGYDETSKRISASLQFIYQPSGGDSIVEVSQSVAYRETRTIDYTPTHGNDEFAAEADVGWASRERIWSRTVIALGQETPKIRLGEAPRAGAARLFTDTIGGERGPDTGDRKSVVAEGWNIVSSTSQVTPQWIGDPQYGQIEVQVLSETVIERYHRKPAARQGGAITPRGVGTPGGTTTPR